MSKLVGVPFKKKQHETVSFKSAGELADLAKQVLYSGFNLLRTLSFFRHVLAQLTRARKEILERDKRCFCMFTNGASKQSMRTEQSNVVDAVTVTNIINLSASFNPQHHSSSSSQSHPRVTRTK